MFGNARRGVSYAREDDTVINVRCNTHADHSS